MIPRPGFVAACLAAAQLVSACGTAGTDTGGASAAGRTKIVVTFPPLGAVVREVVGDRVDVAVLMPNGADPHQWSPSAKDVERILDADLVVDNGLGLEAHLQDTLDEARANGIPSFTVSDHVTVRTVQPGEGAESDDPDQAPGADDPHLWMDPLTMREWIEPFAAEMAGLGVDVTNGADAVTGELDRLDADVRVMVDQVPADHRKLVTGHESMGYFAARYGFHLIGAVVPAITSQAEPSAGQLSALIHQIRGVGVPAVFAELGTPTATIDAVGADAGVQVVELSTHTMPGDGRYSTFILDIATTVSRALA
mgnify:CR=1 FL=1